MRKTAFTLLLLLAIIFRAHSQVSYQILLKNYSGNALIVPDGNGGVCMASNFIIAGSKDSLFLKLTHISQDGQVLWAKDYLSREPLYVRAFHHAPDGRYYLEGMLLLTQQQSFIACMDSAGNPLWCREFFRADSSATALIIYNLLDAKNGLVFYGTRSTVDQDTKNIAVRVDENGNILWANAYKNSWKWGAAASDQQGNIYISNVEDVYSLDSGGKVRWAKKVDAFQGKDVIAVSTLSDGSNIYTCSDKNSAIFLELDKDGNFVRQSASFPQPFGRQLLELPNGDLFSLSGTFNITTNNYAVLTPDFKIRKKAIYLKTSGSSPIGNSSCCLSGGHVFITGSGYSDSVSGAHLTLLDDNFRMKCSDTMTVIPQSAVTLTVNAGAVSSSPEAILTKPLSLYVRSSSPERYIQCLDCRIPNPQLGRDTTFCTWQNVQLNGDANSKNLWQDGSTGLAYTVKKPGKYWVKSSNICGVASDTVEIKLAPPFPKALSVSPRKAKTDEDISFRLDTTNVASYRWDFGDGTSSGEALPKHQYKTTGFYNINLHVTTRAGCDTILSGKLEIYEFHLYVPNTFSPGNDSLNETFGPIGMGWAKYELSVFNRWGERVFEGENKPWDGSFRGTRVPEGVYYYVIHLIDMNDGSKILKKGTVYVMNL